MLRSLVGSEMCIRDRSYGSHSKLWQSLCPPNKSDPGISQPTLMLFKYSAWFPIPSEHLTRAANVPNAQSGGGIGTYGTFFACLCHPLCPKSKWHVPPPAYGFAYGSYSHLCQSLCPPNGSNLVRAGPAKSMTIFWPAMIAPPLFSRVSTKKMEALTVVEALAMARA